MTTRFRLQKGVTYKANLGNHPIHDAFLLIFFSSIVLGQRREAT
jgi:hypothetical protein